MAAFVSANVKNDFCHVEEIINKNVNCPRSKALALTALEESYMWVGKGIRNDQIARYEADGSAIVNPKITN